MDMDVSKLKVAELKEQLIMRGLDSKGLKAALVQRLQEAIDADGSEEPSAQGTNVVSTEDMANEIAEEAPVDSSNSERNDVPIENDIVMDSNEGENNTIPTEVESEDHSDILNSNSSAVDDAGNYDQDNSTSLNPNSADIDNTGNDCKDDNTSVDPNSADIDNTGNDCKDDNTSVDPNSADIDNTGNDCKDDNTSVNPNSADIDNTENDCEDKSTAVTSEVPENAVKTEAGSVIETEQLSEENSSKQNEETVTSDIKVENDSIKIEDVDGEKVSGIKRSHSPDGRDVKRSNVVKDITDEPEFDNSKVLLDWYNSDLSLIIDPKTMLSAKPLSNDGFGYIWSGVRATYGFSLGKYCFEVKITDHNNVDHLTDEPDPHVLRVGWSVDSATMQLGEDPASFGYGGTAKFSYNLKFQDYGCKFSFGDVIGAYLDATDELVTLHYTVNGVYQGVACSLSRSEMGSSDTALFPHVLTKNSAFEVNMGQLESAWFPHPADLADYTFCADAAEDSRTRGTVGPKAKSECTIIMMVGLPSCGKTTWVNNYIKQNADKKFNILGTNFLIDRMRVMGLPRKKNYHGRWDQLIATCTRCLNSLLEMAHKRRRNYIIDQTNVYQSAQRRKMRNFSPFTRRAVVLVPSEEEYASRMAKVVKDEGKLVPDSAIMEMKAAFKLPVAGDYLDEVEFAEEEQEAAQKLVDKYAKEARDAGYLPPWEKNNSRRGNRHRGPMRQYPGWRDRAGSKERQPQRYTPGGWRGEADRRSASNGWRGGMAGQAYNGRSMQPQPWASGSCPQQRWGAGGQYSYGNSNYGGYQRQQMPGGYGQWGQYNQYQSNNYQQYGGGYSQGGYRGGYGRR